jgi:hypothetical protein
MPAAPAPIPPSGKRDPGRHRIAWIDDHQASGAVAEALAAARAISPSGQVPDILRTMSLRPDFLNAIAQASRLHFSDGALTRATHEMIASYVAALEGCHY